jgi:hypothetical protein
MEQEFISLAKMIIQTYKTKINCSVVAAYRLEYLQQMKAELQALKEAYQVVYLEEEFQKIILQVQ